LLKHLVYGLKAAQYEDPFSIFGGNFVQSIMIIFLIIDVVMSVPNNASTKFLNKSEVKGKVVIAYRGVSPLVEKVKLAQKFGAKGLIIIDDGQCKNNFKSCGKRVGSLQEGGFGVNDGRSNWRDVEIPSLLVSKEDGERLLNLLSLSIISIPRFGRQYVSEEVGRGFSSHKTSIKNEEKKKEKKRRKRKTMDEL